MTQITFLKHTAFEGIICKTSNQSASQESNLGWRYRFGVINKLLKTQACIKLWGTNA